MTDHPADDHPYPMMDASMIGSPRPRSRPSPDGLTMAAAGSYGKSDRLLAAAALSGRDGGGSDGVGGSGGGGMARQVSWTPGIRSMLPPPETPPQTSLPLPPTSSRGWGAGSPRSIVPRGGRDSASPYVWMGTGPPRFEGYGRRGPNVNASGDWPVETRRGGGKDEVEHEEEPYGWYGGRSKAVKGGGGRGAGGGSAPGPGYSRDVDSDEEHQHGGRVARGGDEEGGGRMMRGDLERKRGMAEPGPAARGKVGAGGRGVGGGMGRGEGAVGVVVPLRGTVMRHREGIERGEQRKRSGQAKGDEQRQRQPQGKHEHENEHEPNDSSRTPSHAAAASPASSIAVGVFKREVGVRAMSPATGDVRDSSKTTDELVAASDDDDAEKTTRTSGAGVDVEEKGRSGKAEGALNVGAGKPSQATDSSFSGREAAASSNSMEGDAGKNITNNDQKESSILQHDDEQGGVEGAPEELEQGSVPERGGTSSSSDSGIGGDGGDRGATDFDNATKASPVGAEIKTGECRNLDRNNSSNNASGKGSVANATTGGAGTAFSVKRGGSGGGIEKVVNESPRLAHSFEGWESNSTGNVCTPGSGGGGGARGGNKRPRGSSPAEGLTKSVANTSGRE